MGPDPWLAMADMETSRRVEASHDAIGIRNPLDRAILRVFAGGPNQIIQRIRIARRRDEPSSIRTPGHPFAPVLGQLVQRERNAVLEVLLHIHDLGPRSRYASLILSPTPAKLNTTSAAG